MVLIAKLIKIGKILVNFGAKFWQEKHSDVIHVNWKIMMEVWRYCEEES